MKANVGGVDRIVRITAGIVLLALFALDTTRWWGLIGIVLLATGLLSWCPLYLPLGMSTCAREKK
ncbi:MAG: DUF2892 domain-containing protein [Pseudomonadota bacterium]